MRKWTVYFELFGKKMKTTVEADSSYAAQCKVKDKIMFHKTVDEGDVLKNDLSKEMSDFVDMLFGGKK